MLDVRNWWYLGIYHIQEQLIGIMLYSSKCNLKTKCLQLVTDKLKQL